MKNIYYFFNLFILFSIFISKASAENYTFKYDGKKYEIVTQKETWLGASLKAAKQGGYLVQINSKEEQDTIWSAIRNGAKIPMNYTIVQDGGGIAYIWIGANDLAQEGEWIWDGDNDGKGTKFWSGQGSNGKNDGKSIDDAYVNWGGIKKNGKPAEPDNFGNAQNAAAIGLEPWPKGMGLFGQAGEWNDINPTNQIYYIIEYDETTYIEPNQNEKFCIKDNCSFAVSPIPFNNYLSVQIGSKDYSSLSIYDQFGKEVFSKHIDYQDFVLPTEHLASGVYILALKNGNVVTTKMLMKN